MEAPQSVLVTGVAGFIGGNFARKFRESFPRTNIIGLDDFSNSSPESVPTGITFYQGSIADPVILDKIFSEHTPEYVFNFAAKSSVPLSVDKPVATTDDNVSGTVNLFKKAADYRVKRVIHSSSSAVYGTAKKLPTKESENIPDPVSPYGAQKLAIEPFAKIFGQLYGLDVVCLRYFNVFGPGQRGNSPYSTVVSAWLEALYFPQNKKAVLFGDGLNRRDFCYVDDVVDANIACMMSANDFRGEVFNIGSGKYISVNEVQELIEKQTGKKLDLERLPARAGDARDTLADISKAAEWFGYAPKISFEAGLARAVGWFEQLSK